MCVYCEKKGWRVERETRLFLKEARILKSLRHKNIVVLKIAIVDALIRFVTVAIKCLTYY